MRHTLVAVSHASYDHACPKAFSVIRHTLVAVFYASMNMPIQLPFL